MDLLFGLAVFVALLAIIYGLGWCILGPLDRAARARRASLRVSMADLLCLFVVVQVPLTLVSFLRSEETEMFFWLLTILAWVAAPVIWIACAITLSRAGVVDSKHRMVFMGLVLPVVYYGLIPFVVFAAATLFSLLEGERPDLFDSWWWIALWLGTGIALTGCGLFTHRLARSAINSAAPHTEADDHSNESP